MEEECPDAAETIILSSLTSNHSINNNSNNNNSHIRASTVFNKTIKKIQKFCNFEKKEQQLLDQDQEEEPTTSRTSMSVLREADFATSQHDHFPEVLDDETTTSGVLETFEISSSSLPTSSDGNATVAVEDSSSTDTIKMVEVSSDPTSCNNEFFNGSEVYVINDDEDDDEDDDDGDGDGEGEGDDDDDDDNDDQEEEDADDEVEDDDENANNNNDDEHEHEDELERLSLKKTATTTTTTSANQVNATQSTQSEQQQQQQQTNSVIVTKSGAAIYLETPMIEDQQHHSSQMLNGDGGRSDYLEMAGKPKCLNDKFLLEEDDDEDEDGDDDDLPSASSKVSYAIVQGKHEHRNNNNNNNNSMDMDESVSGLEIKSDICTTNEVAMNDDKVATRLKWITLDNATNNETKSRSSNSDVHQQQQPQVMPLLAEIESMDLIERRDFETEQQLTGGIILKSSSLVSNDKLNLNIFKSLVEKQKQKHQPNKGEGVKDCPCSSNSISGRAVSSDSKYTYKDPTATPTSSRTYNSRLTKSTTAKLNLNTTLNQSQPPPPPPQQELQQILSNNSGNVCTYKIIRKSQFPASGLSTLASVIKVAPSTITTTSASTVSAGSVATSPPSTTSSSSSSSSASSGSSSSSISSVVLAGRSNLSSNSSSSDSTAATATKSKKPPTSTATTTTGCQQQQQQKEVAAETRAGLAKETGCSRTSGMNPLVLTAQSNSAPTLFDDTQPSTSSARCHYAPASRSLRQVHASAQTNERYMIRPPSLNRSSESSNTNNNATTTSNSTRISRNPRQQAELYEAISAFKAAVAEVAEVAIMGVKSRERSDFNEDDSWADCEENNSDIEEICTCHQNSSCGSSHGGSVISLNDGDDTDVEIVSNKESELSNFIQMVSISEEPNNSGNNGGGVTTTTSTECNVANPLAIGNNNNNTNTNNYISSQQRKRKYNESRLLDSEYNMATTNNTTGFSDSNLSRKRIAYDFASTTTTTPTATSAQMNQQPINAPQSTSSSSLSLMTTPTSTINSPYGRRTPRTLIPTRDNPPPEMPTWLEQFQRWSHAERLLAIDNLIEHCEPTQVRHMMKVIEPQFQRDFISLLPRELALQVLSYLDPKDLLRAAQTCRSWRFLCDDNLLWKEKCRKTQILTEPCTDKPKRGRAGNMPPIASPWKAAYMRQHIIEMNWRSRPIREPKVLKGHDDHVITCLQFSGNRIVSGSDDNTLKVWSAVTGRCLRTLVGHTGGVWSSQMSGNVIISGSTDRTLKVWDMETGQCVHTLLGHTSTVRCMHLHGNKVVSGSRDATLRVWDIAEGSCLHVLTGHLAAVRCVQYDGKLIVSGAYDYMVKIWHPERQECLHTLQGHTNRVYSLQFDGIHVVSGSLDTSIRVWDVETGNCKHTLMGHQSLTSGMELRQNILVSGNADSTVKVWDITTGQCLQTLSGSNKHQSAVTCLQFNSRFVITSSDDGTVKLWDVKTGEFIRNLVALDSGGSGGVVWRIRANDTKLICAVGSRNGTEETKLMVLDFDVEGACVKCS